MTRMLWTLRVLLSHWTRHRLQLATLLIGLMSATALFSGVQAINGEARTSYDRAANALGRNATLVPAHDATVPQALFAALRRGGWPVSPLIEGSVRIGARSINLVGLEPLSLPRGDGLDMQRVSGRIWNLPLPGMLLPRITAEERVDEGGRHRFEVDIGLPLFGRLVAYRGYLVL